MAFQISPSVLVTEKDLTNLIPALATSIGAIAGEFNWGPVGEINIISGPAALASVFGKTTDSIYKDFLIATSFLSYSNNLKVIRAESTGMLNSTDAADSNGASADDVVKNASAYQLKSWNTSGALWVAKYPGVLGDNIGVAWADTAGFNATDSNDEYTWPFRDLFTSEPSTNEFHVVVYDATGDITGEVNSAIELFPFVSSVSTAKYYDGTSGYFKTRINNGSAWVWVGNTSLLTGSNVGVQLAGGSNGSAVTDGNRISAYGLLLDAESVDVNLVMQGAGGTTVGSYIIQDLAETRKDCIALVSPLQSDVVGIADDATILTNLTTTRNNYGSSSYAVMDSAYKLMYDQYRDVNVWVPLNGDIAGLCAQTDLTNDPWWSPAGLNRGVIKNCIALSNPQVKATRDALYNVGINPCVVFQTTGPVLWGDKTLQSRPSAFDRINVRRLFITLEKAIATASKYLLFEQNDDFTRARFINMVEPYLRTVLARRGITDFKVVCDSTNNPGDVIDANEFVADIYIKPTRSINYIQLNFVAVSTGVSFDEVVGS